MMKIKARCVLSGVPALTALTGTGRVRPRSVLCVGFARRARWRTLTLRFDYTQHETVTRQAIRDIGWHKRTGKSTAKSE